MLTTDQKGAIAELAIAHTAAECGVGVFKPLTDGERYDLIFDLRPKLVRVQCKWANKCGGAVVVRCYSCRRNPRRMLVRMYSAHEVDAIAAFCPETDGCYLLPPSLFTSTRFVHLRVEPSRNNQRCGINWADDFESGARLRVLLGP